MRGISHAHTTTPCESASNSAGSQITDTRSVPMKLRVVCGLIAAALGTGVTAAAQNAHLQITVTNITKAQTFTPILVAVHKPGVHLFELGSPASVELEQLAESGSTAPLEGVLNANPLVKTAVDTGATLAPG